MPQRTTGTRSRKPAVGLIICCKDYRYIQRIQTFAKRRLGIVTYDLKATAGGVRSLLDAPAAVRRWILRDIALVYEQHEIRRVLIVQHQDCAAYGGSHAFATAAAEQDFHARQLRRAARILSTRFPRMQIELFFARQQARGIRCYPVARRASS